jgi:hypothetical protein
MRYQDQRDYPDYHRDHVQTRGYTLIPDHPPRNYPQERCPKKFNLVGTLRRLSMLTTGGAVVAGAVLLTGALRTGSDFMGNLSAMLNKPQPEPKVDIRSTVVQQVRNASELTTAVYSMETVVPTSRERTLGGYVIGKTTLLYIAYGEVRAGIDLTAFKPEDVQVSGDKLYLRLPSPKILDSKIDVNRSKVYDYDRGFLGLGPDAAPELQELAQRKTLQKIEATACSGGVLQTASDRAKSAISRLLITAGYKNVTIEMQPPQADACSSTSQPANAQPTSGEEPAQPDAQAPIQQPAQSVTQPDTQPDIQPSTQADTQPPA